MEYVQCDVSRDSHVIHAGVGIRVLGRLHLFMKETSLRQGLCAQTITLSMLKEFRKERNFSNLENSDLLYLSSWKIMVEESGKHAVGTGMMIDCKVLNRICTCMHLLNFIILYREIEILRLTKRNPRPTCLPSASWPPRSPGWSPVLWISHVCRRNGTG